MAGQFQFRPDRRSGPLLASTLVLFLGAIAAAVVTTASGKSPYFGLLIFAAFAAVVPICVIFLRVTPQRTLTSLYGWIQSRNTQPKTDYQLRTVRTTRAYGTNRPPSVDDLKDLKDGPNNWVPSKTSAPSSKRQS